MEDMKERYITINSTPDLLLSSVISKDTHRAALVCLHRKFACRGRPFADALLAANLASVEPRYLEETLRHLTLRQRVLQLLPKRSKQDEVSMTCQGVKGPCTPLLNLKKKSSIYTTTFHNCNCFIYPFQFTTVTYFYLHIHVYDWLCHTTLVLLFVFNQTAKYKFTELHVTRLPDM